MRGFLRATATLLVLSCATGVYAQQSQPAAAVSDTAAASKNGAVPNTGAVPNVIRFSGSFRPSSGMPAQSVESVTLSIYRDQTGGTPLWQETQNVAVDGEGKYSVLMGSTQNDGVPLDLLSAGEPRWLGVQFNRPGEPEQPRVLMASVPYALKSVDAETLGGKPASAYLLAAGGGTAGSAVSNTTAGTTAGTTTAPGGSTTVLTSTAVKPRANNGTPGFIGVFTDATDLGNSVMQQSGGYIGVGTVPGAGANTTPSLDLRTSPFSQIGMAQTTDYLTFFSSDLYGPAIYWNPGKDLRFGKGGTGLYNAFGFVEQMRIQSSTGNLGIGTQAPATTLDVNGNINFGGSVWWQRTPVLQLPSGMSSGTVVNGTNVALGVGALQSNSTGLYNLATGAFALQHNVGGNYNTASGYGALATNVSGNSNLAIGYDALNSNTGSFNTAVGINALASNGGGGDNVAVGYNALLLNIGSSNTAVGTNAMSTNGFGGGNVAIGYDALLATTGSNNTAVGFQALQGGPVVANNTGFDNTAIGNAALQNDTTGYVNTAMGAGVLFNNTTGLGNIAIGVNALQANVSGNYNVALGVGAGNVVLGSDNIDISNFGLAGDDAVIRIGTQGDQIAFFGAGIYGASASNTVPVVINSSGQLIASLSSQRYKEDIQDMGDASRGLMDLRPVTFRYKKAAEDGTKPLQYGLIAEEVAEVYPDLVVYTKDGKPDAVQYQNVNAMLLNEVQRQQAESIAQKEQIRRLEERLAKMETALASMSGISTATSVHANVP